MTLDGFITKIPITHNLKIYAKEKLRYSWLRLSNRAINAFLILAGLSGLWANTTFAGGPCPGENPLQVFYADSDSEVL